MVRYILGGVIGLLIGAFWSILFIDYKFYTLPKNDWECITHFIPNDVNKPSECWMYKNNKFIIYGPDNRRGSNNFPNGQPI